MQSADGALAHQKRLAVERSTNLMVANTVTGIVDVYALTATGAELVTALEVVTCKIPTASQSIRGRRGLCRRRGNGRILKCVSDGAPTPTCTQTELEARSRPAAAN